jgi:hypothetical protein
VEVKVKEVVALAMDMEVEMKGTSIKIMMPIKMKIVRII